MNRSSTILTLRVNRLVFLRRALPMSTTTLFKSLVLSGVALLTVSCLNGESHSRSSRLQATISPTPQTGGRTSPSPSPTAYSPIRSVDFDNISYPNLPDYSDPSGYKKKRITLKPGEGGPSHISYGDITGDGIEEAMVVLPIENRGSAIPYYVYIFTLDKGQPKLIWDFETGDRADGGLRQVYAENSELVIELYGKGKTIGGDLYAEDGMTGGDCCPTHFTRARYQWQGNRFRQKGREEILSNPVGGAPVVMPRYGSSG